MPINFNLYVQYRGRQFEKLFSGKKRIVYITNQKAWLKFNPGDTKTISKKDGLCREDGYIYIDPKITDIHVLDSTILHELTHIYHWNWMEWQVRKFVKEKLGN